MTIDITTAIQFAELPAAHFIGEQAVHEHGYAAARYEHVVATFALDGDEPSLWESLRALGFDREEIAWHVQHRGQRMRCGYV